MGLTPFLAQVPLGPLDQGGAHGDSKVAAVVKSMDAQKPLTPLENIVVEAESTQGTVVWSSTQKDHPAIPEGSPSQARGAAPA